MLLKNRSNLSNEGGWSALKLCNGSLAVYYNNCKKSDLLMHKVKSSLGWGRGFVNRIFKISWIE